MKQTFTLSISLAIGGILFLAACQSGPPYINEKWRGIPVATLVTEKGEPDFIQKEVSGEYVYVYRTKTDLQMPGTQSTSGSLYKKSGMRLHQGKAVTVECVQYFYVDENNIIRASNYSGQGC